jgi:hypothetical protein
MFHYFLVTQKTGYLDCNTWAFVDIHDPNYITMLPGRVAESLRVGGRRKREEKAQRGEVQFLLFQILHLLNVVTTEGQKREDEGKAGIIYGHEHLGIVSPSDTLTCLLL